MKEDLRQLSVEDLARELENSRAKIREARYQFAVTRTLENSRLIRNERKRVAQLLTIARERELISQRK